MTEGLRLMLGEKVMFYTYILCSLSQPEQRYIGSTSDLSARLSKHNAGEVPRTSKFKPWKIESYFAFETKLHYIIGSVNQGADHENR